MNFKLDFKLKLLTTKDRNRYTLLFNHKVMLSSWSSCCANISQRWVFAIMAFFALWLGNGLRVSLSITITEMTLPIEEVVNQVDDTCTVFEKPNLKNITIINGELYDWDEYLQGIILSSYFWGYAISHIPSGCLAERYGGKHFLGLSIFIPAVLTFLTPVCIKYGEATALIILRTVGGLASGFMYPALGTLLSRWTAPSERTKIGGIIYAGAMLGTVCGTTLSALIIRYSKGWPAVFHVFGGFGMFWYLLFATFCYNSPKQHPYISTAELRYLTENSERKQKPPPAPYKHIFTSKECWAFFISMFGSDYAYFTLASDLPKYMASVVKFSIEDNGYMSSLPYLTAWIFSIFCFWISDCIIQKKWMKLVTIRKILTAISMAPAVFILGASYAECDQTMVVAMFTTGVMLFGASFCSICVNPLDLSPNYSGTLMSIGNGLAAVGGILTPYIVGILTPHQTLQEWRLVFWIIFAVATISLLYVMMYGSAEVQPWNDPEFLSNEKNKIKTEKKGIDNVAVVLEN